MGPKALGVGQKLNVYNIVAARMWSRLFNDAWQYEPFPARLLQLVERHSEQCEEVEQNEEVEHPAQARALTETPNKNSQSRPISSGIVFFF